MGVAATAQALDTLLREKNITRAAEKVFVSQPAMSAALHRRLGAKMVDFGGWEMPVEYDGIRVEHLRVRESCGVFDVSHMGEIETEGPQAVGQLAAELPVSRSAVSQHLKVLKDAGLVSERAAGTRRVYRLNPAAVAALRDQLDTFWQRALASYVDVAEQATEESS
jgi:DNA-binding transcriptional ArsR family regulator